MAKTNETTSVDNNNNNNENANDKSQYVMPKFDNAAWTKLTVDDLYRGDTPDAIEQQCLDLCCQYIGGSWLNANKPSTDITVKRITGGLTNQLYHVRLNDSVQRVPNRIYSGEGEEPVEVAIKLYQAKHMKNFKQNDFERLNDTLILTILSEYGVSPRVYGIFNEGFIQQYHKHEQFRLKHQQDPQLLQQLATLIARVHHLKLPLNKTNDFMMNDVENSIKTGYTIHKVTEVAQELQLPLFSQRSLVDEWKELKQILININAPTVFCYNDFRGSNILVVDDDSDGGKNHHQRLLAVDLEYGSYGARPFDLATFFSEWGKENLFDQKFTGIPPKDDLKRFVQLYVDACETFSPGYKSEPQNSVPVVMQEIQVFMLMIYMFMIGLMIKMDTFIIPSIKFDFRTSLNDLEKFYDQYFFVKKSLIEEGLIDSSAFVPTKKEEETKK